MASDRFIEQIRLARATAAVSRKVRDEARAARSRCLDMVSRDRSLRHRIGEGRLVSNTATRSQPKDLANLEPMRLVGVVDSARGLEPHGHLCWAYRDRAEFRARAAEFMADGIAAGQWIEYVGSGSTDALRAELIELEGINADGASVGVSPVGDFYRFTGHGDVVDPVAAVAARVDATEKALSAGYTGFRAVVDATAVVRSAKQRDALARYEHLLDREMCVRPVSALCAYDAGELGSAAVAELACLHPLASSGSAPFQLHAERGVGFALVGDIDLSCDELFATTLRHVVPLLCGPELVVEGRAVEFIDHRRLLMLAEATQRAGATVVLRNAPGTAARVIEVLKLPGVRVEERR
jgi:MEDS: MEthanogen/methylotroph, DcmR Sensory domain